MRVFEAMSEQVRTVAPTMGAADAWHLMKTQGMHHLVVTEKDKVVGVLSDRDIAPRRRLPSAAAAMTVAEVMSAPVATIEKGETVRKAANLMEGRTIGCLPVMQGSKLVGIITTSDLLRLLGKGGERPTHNERATLSHKVPHKKVHVGAGRW
ncbi:MAG: CBS domain-containing protein [Acidobacteria bacterium]|nr:CBS domain-containing protein [Acidobacteriota bacterium]